MDIGRDLFYNENTVHSGNLPGAGKPGRETMQMKNRKKYTDKIRQAGLLSALFLMLCGCTKKEEILLMSTDTAEVSEGQSALTEDAGRTAEGADRLTAAEDSALAESPSAADAFQAGAAAEQGGVIYVHVCGAVVNPGVYELETGSRVYEAVGQAGGFEESADQNYVNQAQVLEDGVMLVIPTKEETAAFQDGETSSAQGTAREGAEERIGVVGGTPQDGQTGAQTGSSGGRININTASEAQLCEIPGVGAARAAAIAAYRDAHGAFGKPEDIMNVSGIKEGMYEKIKDSICVK